MKMSNITVKSSKEAVMLVKDKLSGLDHEEMYVLFLTPQCKPIALEMMFKGMITSVQMDVRLLVKRALELNAIKLVICHNHPFGDPNPSKSDIERTKMLGDACKLFDIQLLDSIVIGDESYYSYNEEQVWRYEERL